MSSYQSDRSKNLSLNSSFVSLQKQGQVSFPFSLNQNLSFNNSSQEYTIIIEADGERLSVQVEERFDSHMWKGEFTSHYVEEITRKTGKERSFTVFIEMLNSAITQAKGSSSFFVDLLAVQDLQLLKARKGNEENIQQQPQLPQSGKKYFILTHVGDHGKVHYPLPLNPCDTGVFALDQQTMQQMVKRMSQTLTEFKGMSNTVKSESAHGQQSFGNFQGMGGQGRSTAKEFFSRENLKNPSVEENQILKDKLKRLEEAKQLGGAVSLNSLVAEKRKIENDLHSYQNITQKEITKLKSIKHNISREIEDTKSELYSLSELGRPGSALSSGIQQIQSQTMTSNFNGSNMTEVEDLRRQLADASIDLEEAKLQYKKQLALQSKDLEESYEQLSEFRQGEKTMRVKVNQLENEVSLQIKRLDIICKSKGLPRPQRRNASQGSATYASPYRQASGQKSTGNSATRKPSPYRNQAYTPPNKRNYSPASQGSAGAKGKIAPNFSPSSQTFSISLRNRQVSPGGKSNTSNNSNGKPSRLYSPSGQIRDSSPGSGMYGSNGNQANRVRREPAVGGGDRSRSNPRARPIDSPQNQSGLRQKQNSTVSSVYSQGSRKGIQKASPIRQQPASTTNVTAKFTPTTGRVGLFSGNKVLSQQKPEGTIDEKIDRLQNLLKMAKNN